MLRLLPGISSAGPRVSAVVHGSQESRNVSLDHIDLSTRRPAMRNFKVGVSKRAVTDDSRREGPLTRVSSYKVLSVLLFRFALGPKPFQFPFQGLPIRFVGFAFG